MADKRISQLVERVTLATNDVFPIVASGATTTNKVTLQTIDDYMQTNLDFGVTSVAISVPTGLSVTGTPITSTGTFVITFTAGYSIPTNAKQTQWDTAYTNRITSATAPLGIASNVISITQSGASTDGYLSSTDWNTFNNKQSTITTGNLTEATSSVLTITGGTGAVLGSGTSIQVKQASGSQDGFLDSADWTTFNDKQNALSGTGIVKSTGGTISYLTDSTSNWDSAYNDKINSAAVTGTTTKTLTLTQQDGGTITTTWTDLDTGTVTSVGVSMPSAFSVSNSPITSSGTIAITGAGTTAQYIDGTGALQTFPNIISQATNLVTEVYNNSGATLSKGTVVYITGGQGNLPTISKALATGDSTSAQTYGVVQTDITNMNNGYVVVAGRLIDLDTQAYSNGTQLYLSATTAGTWTSTKQYAPNHLVYVGIVVRSHPTQGVVEVKIQNGYEMDEIHDVSAQNPNNNDILQYKTATGLWTKTAGTTSNIAEGSNLYYTDARSRSAFSESVTGLDYNSSTGVLSTTTGYAIPTTASQTNWDAAYNDKINSAAVTGTTTKTLTLNQQDGGTITASWTDINTDAVSSVFGRTGAVVATSGDYNTDQVTEGSSSLYFTNARSRSSISLTTTGTSGAATYNSTTGVLNIPAYIGGVTSVNTLTGAVTLTTSNIAEGTNLYYTDTRARAAISLTTTGSSGAATYSGGVLNIPNYGSALSGYLPLTGGTLTNTGGNGTPILSFSGSSTAPFQWMTSAFNSSMIAGNTILHFLGKAAADKDAGYIGFQWNATGSNTNYISLGFFNYDHLFKFYANGNANVNGTISASNFSGSSSGTNTGDQTLAGLGGVPTSRTLTINGTAFDLSANRSWTIATGGTLQEVILNNGTTNTGFVISNANSTYSTPASTNVPVIYIHNTGANANAHAILSLRTLGTTGGDPFVSFDLNGVTGYTIGQDNTDSKLKISGGWTSVGTNTFLEFNTSGYAKFFNDLEVVGLYRVPNTSYFISGTQGYRFNNSGDTENNFIVYNDGNTYTRGNAAIGTKTFNDKFVVQGGVIAKYTTSGIDGTFDNLIKFGYFGDLNTSGSNNARWAGIDASITAGAGVSNVIRIRAYGGGTGNAAPTVVADFRGDGTTRLYGALNTDGGITSASNVLSYSATGFVGAYSTNPANDAVIFSGWTSGNGMEMRYNPNSAIGYIQNRYPVESGQAFGDIHFRRQNGSTFNTTMLLKGYSANVIIGDTGDSGGRLQVVGTDYANRGVFTVTNLKSTSSGAYYPALLAINSNGNHSYGIVAEFRITNTDTSDRPAILFSRGSGINWVIGMGATTGGSDNFRIGRRASYPEDNWAVMRMDIDGSGNVTFSGDVTAYSDSRLKTDVQVIDNAIEKVKQIRGVTFKRNDENEVNIGRKHAGVIAQEVLKVLPEVVSMNDTGMYNVAYGNMVGLLVEAIKEQQKEIDELKKQVA